MDERFYDFASCFTLTNLMKAARDCCKGTDWKYQPQSFMARRLTNCAKLLEELEYGTYHPSPVKKFTVRERGKLREVKPVNFRDRVVQRCICDHVLVPLMESVVSPDNSACLKGRGLTYAFERVRQHAADCPYDGLLVQFDFSGYFASIDQDTLIRQLAGLIEDPRMFRVLEVTIRDDEQGLELGSHVSQLCATLYLNDIDWLIASMRGVTGYHRYMDDGVIFCASRDAAELALGVLEGESQRLSLKLNKKKTHIEPVRQPFIFCKMRFHRLEDGTVRMNVRKQQSRRAVKHAKSVKELAGRKPELDIDLMPVEAALSGYLNRGDADLDRLLALMHQ